MSFSDLTDDEQLRRLRDAAERALRHWGLSGASLDLIKYRENAVFSVKADGRRAALRLHRAGYHSDAELRSELQWMGALANAGIRVPDIVPLSDGELFARIDVDGMSVPMQVDLFDWIDGEQLGSVEAGINDPAAVKRTYRVLGELAARVHNQASGWRPPAGFTRHAWDARGLAGTDPFWGRFWELAAASPAERRLMERARQRILEDLSAEAKTPDRYSMIHADFAPENIMLSNGELRLIDFDDAGFGWHLFELATALYFVMSESYFDTARDAMIEGYRTQRELPDSELERLPLFFLARGFTYVGWVHTRPATETARELTPMLLQAACDLARDYLD